MAKKPQVRPATTDETARIIDALTTAHQNFDSIASSAGVDPDVARVELLRLFRAGHVIKFLTSYRLPECGARLPEQPRDGGGTWTAVCSRARGHNGDHYDGDADWSW